MALGAKGKSLAGQGLAGGTEYIQLHTTANPTSSSTVISEDQIIPRTIQMGYSNGVVSNTAVVQWTKASNPTTATHTIRGFSIMSVAGDNWSNSNVIFTGDTPVTTANAGDQIRIPIGGLRITLS